MASSIHTHSSSQKTFFHTLSSRTSLSKEVLVITGYDYFLQKNDLKKLLQKYIKIILVPRSVTDVIYLGEEIGNILTKYDKIHLVNNPVYDQQYRIVYQVAVKNSKIIRITTVQEFCEKTLKKIYVSETIDDYENKDFNLHYFSFGIRVIKKSFDWGIGGLFLIGSLPVWAIAYVKIKKESPGPAFFRQKRVAIRNNEFECIKFRSMRLDAEINGAQFSSKNDERIFPFGKFMRATRIDELPQLVNIVKGEMSLIGPRPERKIFTDAFEETIPHYSKRHVVKPGISGYAQVMYPYGAGVSDARHKLMYDLYYIKNWSIALELSIIVKTAWTIIAKRGM